MTTARSLGVGVEAVSPTLVEVEAHLGNGLPGMTIVGLPDAAVSESRERIRAALVSSGVSWPERRLTIALLPSGQRKRGAGLDLSIGAAVLVLTGCIPQRVLDGVVLIGEVGLDGRIRPVEATFLRVLFARQRGLRVLVPPPSLPEARMAEDLLDPADSASTAIAAVRSVGHLIDACRGDDDFLRSAAEVPGEDRPAVPDLADVAGQPMARAGLEVAAAGGHNLFMVGPPGVGKTMLAERLVGVLPPLERSQLQEVAGIASLLSDTPVGPAVLRRPFIAPHHTVSHTAMIGGGSAGVLRPGLITAAHRGVLFLDEAPEFDRRCLQALRQPLEQGWIDIDRTGGRARMPAAVQVVLAANPCPCGKWAANGAACECPVTARLRYRGKLRGPLLDRIDLSCWLDRPSLADLARPEPAESSAAVAARVRQARSLMQHRWAGHGWDVNAGIPGPHLLRTWPTTAGTGLRALQRRVAAGDVSVRGMHRVLRVAWTLADLAGAAAPTDDDVEAALALRVPAGWGEP